MADGNSGFGCGLEASWALFSRLLSELSSYWAATAEGAALGGGAKDDVRAGRRVSAESFGAVVIARGVGSGQGVDLVIVAVERGNFI